MLQCMYVMLYIIMLNDHSNPYNIIESTTVLSEYVMHESKFVSKEYYYNNTIVTLLIRITLIHTTEYNLNQLSGCDTHTDSEFIR